MFHQVTDCERNRVDDSCIRECDKSASITNLLDKSFHINKSPGTYHTVYNDNVYLNTDIVTDVPDKFSGFLIDLRNIKTGAKTDIEKSRMIKLYGNHIQGDSNSTRELRQIIYPSTNAQYIKGI